jgi:hypothetical protein
MTLLEVQRRFGMYFLDDIIDWIQKNLEPDDVFTDKQLLAWAYESGLTEKDDEDER